MAKDPGKKAKRWLIFIAVIAFLAILLFVLSDFLTDLIWFGEVGYTSVFLTELFTAAKAEGIHTCLDTSGICFNPAQPEPARALLAVTDLVMLDIKQIDSEKHRALTGHPNENILKFAEFISTCGVPLWVRHVVVPGLTDDPQEHEQLGRFIGRLRTLKGLDILPYHDMGRRKYESLGIPYPLPDTPPASKETAAAAKAAILRGIKQSLRAAGSARFQ